MQNILRSFLRLVLFSSIYSLLSRLTVYSTYEANQGTKLLIPYEGEYL